ncbi:unnamed protein product [Cylicocyclus nassatus]|uniref:Uncharacterized protein n=1 Tax=Cylicocyclus nassatus TaxID=53992 RepID=A0AA36HCP2_CYLNA|nr:unnamed protein product [Cylicocyclus nassatus]
MPKSVRLDTIGARLHSLGNLRHASSTKMMRHFVAFSLLLFVLEISVEASFLSRHFGRSFCLVTKDTGCRARCLKQNCQNGHCKIVERGLQWGCFCEDCSGGQAKN